MTLNKLYCDVHLGLVQQQLAIIVHLACLSKHGNTHLIF